MSDPDEVMPERQLGADVAIVFFDYGPISPGGIVLIHRDRYGNLCVGSYFFDHEETKKEFPDRPLWHVEQLVPLTLTPSLVCRACGLHGYIRNGQWEVIP